jgi:hypothetical protein
MLYYYNIICPQTETILHSGTTGQLDYRTKGHKELAYRHQSIQGPWKNIRESIPEDQFELTLFACILSDEDRYDIEKELKRKYPPKYDNEQNVGEYRSTRIIRHNIYAYHIETGIETLCADIGDVSTLIGKSITEIDKALRLDRASVNRYVLTLAEDENRIETRQAKLKRCFKAPVKRDANWNTHLGNECRLIHQSGEVRTFPSLSRACLELGLNSGALCRVRNGKLHHHKGWRFAE